MYKSFPYGLLGSNTYVVFDEVSLEGMIVDTGNEIFRVTPFIEKMGIKIKYIVQTHAHFDHAEFLDVYRARYPEALVVAHEREIALLTDPEANLTAFVTKPKCYDTPDLAVDEGDELTLGESVYKVLSTPGHTPGSICLYNKAERLMLTGDTLFECGRGRCDLKFGSELDMAHSLKRLLAMDGDIEFLPGHGGPSRIECERGRVF